MSRLGYSRAHHGRSTTTCDQWTGKHLEYYDSKAYAAAKQGSDALRDAVLRFYRKREGRAE